MSYYPKIILIGLVLVIGISVFLFAYISNWPVVGFESSDRRWGDHENQIKGRYFDEIVFYFETYKMHCKEPNVTMVRTTAKNPWNIFAWPNYLMDDKWKLEYQDVSNLSEIVWYQKCYYKEMTEQERDLEYQQLDKACEQFLKELSATKSAGIFAE